MQYKYIMIIKRLDGRSDPIITKGTRRHLRYAARKFFYLRNLNTYSAETDQYIKDNYRRLGPSQIARDLKFTKNAVISRYHKVLCGKRG